MSQLQCPLCNSPETWVVDTRPVKAGTRRRYECPGCKRRFTTYETVVINEDEALAQEIERKSRELQALLEKADQVKRDLARLKLRQQDGKITEVKAERPKGRPRKEAQEPLGEPIIISSLNDFRSLGEGNKAEAFKQALQRARQKVKTERNGAGG